MTIAVGGIFSPAVNKLIKYVVDLGFLSINLNKISQFLKFCTKKEERVY